MFQAVNKTSLSSFCFCFFNWRKIALQCFVGFCHTTMWISHKYTYVPCLLNLLPHTSPHPTALGSHRAHGWPSCVIQQLLISYLFYIWYCICLNATLSICPHSFPPRLQNLFLMSLYLFSLVQVSRSLVSDFLQPHESQHARPPCPSPAPWAHPKPCPSTRWCHPAISSSVVPFSSCPQSLPASGSFPMSQLFASGGQSTRISALASVLPMNTQDWSPLGWTGWIFLQSKGLSRVFSNTTVQKHQSFGTQLSL